MNAIDILTREKLKCQYWLERYTHELMKDDARKVKQELSNIERALETLKSEAKRKVGVER